jgi:hypothetical protein
MAGGELPTEGRTGGRWRTAAGSFRRAKEGRAGPGGCSGARGSYWCSRFGKELSGGASPTVTGAGGANGAAARSVHARGEGPGRLFIGNLRGKRGHGKLSSGLGMLAGRMDLGCTAAAGNTGGGAAVPQAPWRAGRAPAGGNGAVAEQRGDAWTGKSRGWPAVTRGGALRRRQKNQGRQSRGSRGA